MNKHTVWQRFRAKTPPFFKRLRVFGLALAGFAEGLLLVKYLPEKLATILQTMAWVGGAIAFVSQFAVDQTAQHQQ